MNATTAIMKTTRPTIKTGVMAPHVPFLALSHRSITPRGKPTTMPAKISSDIPLPIPRSVNLLAQPHDECTARGQSQHGHQDEAGTGMKHKVTRLLQSNGDAERLHRAEDYW